jgi:hypothetical protein
MNSISKSNSRIPLTFAIGFALLIGVHTLHGQNAPMISGAVGFLSSNNAGTEFFQPVASPVVAAPIGEHLLAEARFNFDGFYEQTNRTGPYHGSFFKSTQVLQLDFLAHPKLTIVVGRFLLPFNTYNERLSQLWIQNFQDAPIISALGTRTTGSGDGIQLRGNIHSDNRVKLDYTTYFSVRSNVGQFQAARAAGIRGIAFFPGTRVEVGGSYARFLQQTNYNTMGAHFYWLPYRIPLQIRSEYARTAGGQGYWIENSYRLSQFGGAQSILGRVEPLFRLQQYFRNAPFKGDGAPSADAKQADFGLDYHFSQNIRFNSSYSRVFSTSGDGNVWDLAITYRLLYPLWKAK